MIKDKIHAGLLTFFTAGALFLLLFPQFAKASEEWNVYLGQLHSHSGYLDAVGPAEEVYASAKEAGMDFFALTDYSHSFDNAEAGAISADGGTVSSTWREGKEAAAAVSGDRFTAIYGYEMAWNRDRRLGHIVTLNTPGWQCRGQDDFQKLVNYYDALVSAEGSIGMFCHPGNHYGNFDAFSHYSRDYDAHMALVEVVGEDGETFFDGYQTALDAGWHVAPAANGASHTGGWGESQVRTGILANDLTEESLYEAILARRVYATLDPDLKLQYSLGGHIMGSRVTGLDSYTAAFSLSEPEGRVEILSRGGEVVASCDASASFLTVPAGYPYYYLRLLRDGEILAVTAPVWVAAPKDFGVGEITASTSVPVQNEELSLSFTLYNHEGVDWILDRISLTADDILIWEDFQILQAGELRTFTIPYTHHGVGVTQFQLTVSGTISGEAVSFEKTLTLSYRPKRITAQILVDGRHSNVDAMDLENLTVLAEKADMDVAIFRDETPEGGKVWIVPAPDRDFSENYPHLLADFVENGGQLILFGQAGNNDRMNALLTALGSSLRLNNNTARDPVHNGGRDDQLYTDVFNVKHWENLTGSEVYSQRSGCTVDPGSGTWLVKGKFTLEGDAPVLLAKEHIGKGTVYLAGSFFLNGHHMPLPKNQWDSPTANQRLLESILGLQRSQLDVTDIQTVRRGEAGEFFRVKGYVTAGTANPYNRFPHLIYIQDKTGGIEVTAFDLPDMEVGTKLDITGQLHMDGKNPALKLISCKVIPGELHRFAPDRLFHAASMNYERHGGELMKVEGIARDIELTEDGLGVRRFTLVDPLGDPAKILIEDYILSGAYGVNYLTKDIIEGETVRAYGILHLEQDGTPVLRVRNCDEVTNIPPVPVPPEKDKGESTNPKTGDSFFTFDNIWSTMFRKEG